MNWLPRSGLIVMLLLGLILPAGQKAPIASAQAAGVRIVETTDTSFVFEIDIPAPTLTSIEVEGRTFQQLAIPDFSSVGQPGAPALPQTSVTLGIPAEGDVTVRVLDGKADTLPETLLVYPAPDYMVSRDPASGEVDAAQGVQTQFAFNADAYAVDSFQPDAVVSVAETAFVRSQRVARVLIQPVQYNAAQQTVRVYRSLRVEATFTNVPTVRRAAVADVFDPLLQSQLLNYEQAQGWRAAHRTSKTSTTVYPGDTSRIWFRTNLAKSGMYKITLADLQGADLAPLAAANPANLQVWAYGEQVAAYFIGDADAQFEANEALLFYAKIEPTIYSDTDVYWLSVGNEPGIRMSTSDSMPTSAVTDTTAPATVHLEQDAVYRPDVPKTGVYERWYWTELNNLFTTSRTISTTLPLAVTTSSATVRVVLQGASDILAASPDHRVRVDLNGQAVGVMSWNGFTNLQQQFQAPSGLLRRGINTVTLTQEAIAGVNVDISLLDWVELGYTQSLAALNDVVEFTANSSGQREFQVTGFSAADVLGFDVSNPVAPVRLTGMQMTPDVQQAAQDSPAQVSALTSDHAVYLPLVMTSGGTPASAYKVRFRAAQTTPRSYQLVRTAAVPRVAPLARDTGSTLHDTNNRADYLLVTHRSLWSAAQALATYRRSRGLTVTVVDVQDIYDEWSNGRLDPNAIRSFVAYAYENWQSPEPAYLMLLGSGHYDYRLRTGITTQPILIPPFMACADPWTCEVAVENEYVTVSGNDRMPDLALGRLPARNLTEATWLVNKTISYDSAPPAGSWAGTLTFVADNPRSATGTWDTGGNFELFTENIIALTPSQYAVKRVFYDPYPADDSNEPYRYRTPETTTDAIVAAVNSGTVFLNYTGHAGTTTWAHEAILRTRDVGRNDVTRLTNGARLPIILDMACASGNFADATYTGLEVMMLNGTNGGSVAGWGATGFGVATGHDKLHRGFYQAVYTNGERTLGLATAAGKQALWASGNHLDLLDTFDLLGDPALRINLQPAN
ncbi:MAG: C25 family cysteine peptidase [Anaerolineae bacterium]